MNRSRTKRALLFGPWFGLLLFCALTSSNSFRQAVAAEEVKTVHIVDTGKPDATKQDELKDLLNWTLIDSSQKQGYAYKVDRNKYGDVVINIESSAKTKQLKSEGSSCEGTLETELSATKYKGGYTTSVAFSTSAIVDEPEINNAWFSILIDGKPSSGMPYGPIVTKEDAGAGHGIIVPDSANKIKLVFRLRGEGKATLTIKGFGRLIDMPGPQYQSAPINLDFSKRDLSGWQTRNSGAETTVYRTVLKDESGDRVADLSHAAGSANAGVFEQCIIADSFRGKKVTIDADCRTGSRDTDANIFILSGSSGAEQEQGKWDAFIGCSRNFNSTRINDRWRHYRVSTEIPNDSSKIEFGIHLLGSGNVQIKNVELSDFSERDPGNSPSAKFSVDELTKLASFAKAYGYVRYFYPQTDLSTESWNLYLIWAVDSLLNEKNKQDEESLISSLLMPVAPNFVVQKAQAAANDKDSKTSARQFWKHIGYGVDKEHFNTLCQSGIVQISENEKEAQPGTGTVTSNSPQVTCGPFGIDGTLSCSWPADKSSKLLRKLPQKCLDYFSAKPQTWKPNSNDRSSRIATVIALWNVPRFFYPKRDSLAQWGETLEPALQSAATDPGERTFVRTLQKMTVPLKDDQCRILNNSIDGLGLISTQYSPNLSWQFIGDRLIITGKSNALHPMRPVGRVVYTANNIPLTESVPKDKQFISAGTPNRIMHRLGQSMLLGTVGSKFEVSWLLGAASQSGETGPSEVPLICSVTSEGIVASEVTEKRPANFALLKPGILYVDLTRINPSELQERMGDICKADKVILDCRGSLCRGNESIFEHLFEATPPTPRLQLPIISGPSSDDRNFVDLDFKITTKKPNIAGKIAFLVDERTVGKMELYLSAAEAAHSGIFVGSETAGTAGNVSIAQLPAGYILSWTATKTLKPDGSDLNNRGIVPEQETRPTEAGIRNFHDELLETAIGKLER